MITAGFSFEHPDTGTRVTVLESDAETRGMGWLLEVRRRARVPDLAEHLHETWTETFEIVSGTARYSLDGVEGTLRAGESFVVEPRHFHVHPWNATDDEMVYRQRDRFAQASAAAVQDVLGVLATRAGLIRDGTAPRSALARLLQQAVIARTVTRHGNYLSHPSAFAQQVIGATVGRLGAVLGYRAVHPKYVGG
ncbi:MAG TPA: cupin domain-containing protein [Gemmatimonadales bacterium]|nr:cupin domain-containing protein [Gemmatimonadales bacterium]